METEINGNTYRIKQSSPGIFVIALLAGIFAGGGGLIALGAYHIVTFQNDLFLIICFLPLCLLAFWLARKVSSAGIAIKMDETGLKLTWVKQFIFFREADDEFAWGEITDYVFEPDRQFDRIRLHLKDGYTFSIRHNNDDDGKDDFRRFLDDFIRKVGQINDSDSDKSNDIRIGKNVFESTGGLVMAIVLLAVMILAPVSIFLFPPAKPVQYVRMMALYAFALFFVARVFVARKKRKAYEESLKQN